MILGIEMKFFKLFIMQMCMQDISLGTSLYTPAHRKTSILLYKNGHSAKSTTPFPLNILSYPTPHPHPPPTLQLFKPEPKLAIT